MTISSTETTKKKQSFKTIDIAYIGLFAALMAICSWISIPTAIPFTLQTFAVFLCVGVIGGKRGSMSILIYILLGAIGIPVFAGFTGGLGYLFGTTGGYIIGFLFSALTIWGITHLFGDKTITLIIAMILALIVCYAFGTAWFMIIYMKANGAVSLAAVLGWCVTPFIIPDIVKIAFAIIVTKQLKKHVSI